MRHSQSEIAFLEKNGPEHFAKMFSSLKKISHKLAMVDEVLHDNLNPTPLGTKKSNSHHLQLTVSAMISLWNHPQDYSAEIQLFDLYFYFGVAQNHNEL